jgi:penicillin amidase
MFPIVYRDTDRDLTVRRGREDGVLRIDARTQRDAWWAIGFAHAWDRALQLLLMRVLGYGRSSELLDGSDATLVVDRFFRRMNWNEGVDAQRDALRADTRASVEAYAEGVNAALARRTPWELRLLGYRPEPWRVQDSILLSRMVGYVTLAQSQGEVERLVVQMIQAGVSREKLDELFPGSLGHLDVDLVRRVRIGERIVPESVVWGGVVPRAMASNNWVISGSRTASGKPILANDPHVEINRLPAVWQEMVVHVGDRYAIGGTMPGLPAVLIGRTNDLAWGATYTFMDATDSWIEDCEGGAYLRGSERVPFRRRTEIIQRKKRSPARAVFYENDHGVLDGDPHVPGLYLATRWAAAASGAASLDAMHEIFHAPDVDAGMRIFGAIETAFNWVFADRHGDIGYQMSGLSPKRREGWSGLVPLAGWDPENDWRGFHAPVDLPRGKNPPEGFFATANHDLNPLGRTRPLNAHQGPYRAERIATLLREHERATVEDCFRIQMDLYSAQSPAFLAILLPLLPDSFAKRELASWDGRYDLASHGACVFESFYTELRMIVFGDGGIGSAVMDSLAGETGIFADFFINFDRVLLGEESAWFEGRRRNDLFRTAAERAFAKGAAGRWGDGQRVLQTHMLFGRKLPRALGFDRGPIAIPGGRATVHQGQIYKSGARTTSFAPSIRVVTDMAEDVAFTCLAGGPSDRRLSRWYCSEMKAWREGRFKRLVT